MKNILGKHKPHRNNQLSSEVKDHVFIHGNPTHLVNHDFITQSTILSIFHDANKNKKIYESIQEIKEISNVSVLRKYKKMKKINLSK